jgi:predicted DsbA family dithiol-disulfide isomerase
MVGGLGVLIARRPIGALFAADLEFEPMPGLPGFRRMAGGSISSRGLASGTFSPFVGLDAGDEADPKLQESVAQVRSAICPALYSDGPSGDVVPVASFSDYNCPYCRVQTERLAEMAQGGGIEVAWHELPLLGDTSVTAARAALAAKRQGAYLAFHRRLMRTMFLPSPEYLDVLVDDIGVDRERFLADMQSAEVEDEIRRSRALARIFGFIGTPALVVGRTVVQGQLGHATIAKLIERERTEGPVPGCAA